MKANETWLGGHSHIQALKASTQTHARKNAARERLNDQTYPYTYTPQAHRTYN